MRALIYNRNKQKYDFILVSDDDMLLQAYQSVYKCAETAINSGITAGIHQKPYEDIVRDILKQLSEAHTKAFCCACYIKESCTVLLSWREDIQKYIIKEANIKRILQIIENFMYITLIPESGVLAMHGAAVSKDGRAVLMLASTTSGKSTLAAFMAMRGYEYITDDEIYISCDTMRIGTYFEEQMPPYKAIMLREGGYNVIHGLLGCENDAIRGAQRVLSGEEDRYMIQIRSDTYSDRADCEIAAAVFLNGYESEAPYIRKLNMREAFSRLLKSQLAPHRNSSVNETDDNDIQQIYKVLAHLSDKAYEMEYSDLWTAETYLRYLLA